MRLAAGLPVALARPETERGPRVATLVNAFSLVALVCASLLVGTGALAAWRNVGSLAALTQSRYGRVLLLKLAALMVVALTGLYNWRWARPALGDEAGTTRIRRSMRVELAAGVLILLVTAILVAIPTPADLAD